jgi:hypothetical protein
MRPLGLDGRGGWAGRGAGASTGGHKGGGAMGAGTRTGIPARKRSSGIGLAKDGLRLDYLPTPTDERRMKCH